MSPPADAAQPALSEGEHVLWSGGPAPAVLGVWLFTRVLPATFTSTFLTFWAFAFFGGMWAFATANKGFDPFTRAWPALTVVVPAALVASAVYCTRLRGTYRYFATNQRVIFVGGVLLRRRRSVHYHKVTDVELSQNVLEQLLGIGTLKLFTAGSSGFNPWGGWKDRAEVSFPGLDDPATPERIVNQALKAYRATGE
jgi:uncharacterized membrane protein YdbT with pleckstrin-like domain